MVPEVVIITVGSISSGFDSVVFQTTETSNCEPHKHLTELRDRRSPTRPTRYANDSSNLSNSTRHQSEDTRSTSRGECVQRLCSRTLYRSPTSFAVGLSFRSPTGGRERPLVGSGWSEGPLYHRREDAATRPSVAISSGGVTRLSRVPPGIYSARVRRRASFVVGEPNASLTECRRAKGELARKGRISGLCASLRRNEVLSTPS